MNYDKEKPNEVLFSVLFDGISCVTYAGDDLIEFDNGYSISFFHDQDCCEYVWADCGSSFSPGLPATGLIIKKVEGMGVLINGTLVNCYNDQNGYYSDILEMSVSDGEKTIFKCYDVPKEDVRY